MKRFEILRRIPSWYVRKLLRSIFISLDVRDNWRIFVNFSALMCDSRYHLYVKVFCLFLLEGALIVKFMIHSLMLHLLEWRRSPGRSYEENTSYRTNNMTQMVTAKVVINKFQLERLVRVYADRSFQYYIINIFKIYVHLFKNFLTLKHFHFLQK